MTQPIVAIVGRPNVGKSTLFNRIVGGRVSIVEDTPGITRDRIYQDAEWLGKHFNLVDTGGILEEIDEGSIEEQVRLQAQLAMEEADVILFVVDARTGLLPDDLAVANLLRRTTKPVILVANKVEQFVENYDFAEFYFLGLGDPIPISAAHGMNTGDLLDAIVEQLPFPGSPQEEEEVIKVAVIGKPNVGKSSLVNRLLGKTRAIVTDIPGTTRDALDTPLSRDGRNYVLIDTAGLRRKARIRHSTERYSVFRTLRAVDRCDVALVLLDASEGVTIQDKKIAGIPHEAGKGCVLVVNKWDLLQKERKNIDQFNELIRKELAFLSYAPVISISAFTGQRVDRLLKIVDRVSEQAKQRVETGFLNKYLEEIIALNPPPSDKGQNVKFFYGSQTGVQPPTFVFFVNRPDLIHFSYKRYLENKIREAFGFEGSPLRLFFRERS